MNLAYIVAPKRRDERAPALEKGVAPPQGSDVCVWFDRKTAEYTRDGLNEQCPKLTYEVYEIRVEVKP